MELTDYIAAIGAVAFLVLGVASVVLDDREVYTWTDCVTENPSADPDECPLPQPGEDLALLGAP